MCHTAHNMTLALLSCIAHPYCSAPGFFTLAPCVQISNMFLESCHVPMRRQPSLPGLLAATAPAAPGVAPHRMSWDR